MIIIIIYISITIIIVIIMYIYIVGWLGGHKPTCNSELSPFNFKISVCSTQLPTDPKLGFQEVFVGDSWDDWFNHYNIPHMLHGAGIFTYICPKNHPVM